MCGRTRCTLRPDDVPKASHRHTVPTRFLHLDRYHPSYNVAPGSYMPILRRDNEVVGDGVVVHCMKWGLVPSFTKKTEKPDFFKMFNARSESVAEKASFRRLLPKNRCLVAVDGFYEWKKEGSKKQPYYIHFEDGRPLVFAALFDTWQNSGGETLYTFTILTTTSSSALHWLHDTSVITSLLHENLELLKVLDSEKNKERLFMQCIVDKWTNPKTLVMPVILGDKDSIDTWLDDPSTTKLQPLLSPYEKSDLVWYPVTPAIGKPSFDGPECIQQIPLKASQNSLISKFFSAKQPKADEGDKETKSTDANITVDLKEEPTVEGHEGAIFSDSIKKIEELDEEKDLSNEAKNLEFQKTVKSEPFVEDNSAVVSHLEPVKNEVEDGTYGEGKSIETGLTKERGESNATIPADESYNLDLPRISKEEPDTQGHHRINTIEESNQLEVQHEAVQDKPGNENQKTVLTSQTAKEGGLEFSEKSSEKSGTKRDYEVFSAQGKPRKHFERLQDGKHGRKQGKGKSNIKKSKETQSTLHFFFDEK